MSRKSAKIAAMLSGLESGPWDPYYAGYFECFNRGEYFEAHDVLEELWLAQGKSGANYAFYKGLIQLAGAFVHLQKSRLGPAVALFHLADANLARYPERHDGLDLPVVRELIADWRTAIEASGRTVNPLPLRTPPVLRPGADPDPAVVDPSAVQP